MTAKRMATAAAQAAPKPFVVVQFADGRATLRERGTDPTAPWHRMHELASGDAVAVLAAARLLVPDVWELATCITPTGRLDSHFQYVTGQEGRLVCMFCRKPMGESA